MDMSLLKTGRRPSSGVGGGELLGDTDGDTKNDEDTEAVGERDKGEEPGVEGSDGLPPPVVDDGCEFALASSALCTKWHLGPYGQNPTEWNVRHSSVLYLG